MGLNQEAWTTCGRRPPGLELAAASPPCWVLRSGTACAFPRRPVHIGFITLLVFGNTLPELTGREDKSALCLLRAPSRP